MKIVLPVAACIFAILANLYAVGLPTNTFAPEIHYGLVLGHVALIVVLCLFQRWGLTEY